MCVCLPIHRHRYHGLAQSRAETTPRSIEMCTPSGRKVMNRGSFRVPDPSEVLHTRRGGSMDPHTRLPGYTCSTVLGVTQVWFAAHHVGHVLKTLRSGRLDELHRRASKQAARNPHVLDARVCRAVLWWSILGEAMDAAKEAERRRAKRRESRRLVVVLAVSQRRGISNSCSSRSNSSSSNASTQRGLGTPPSGLPRLPSRTWSLPPLTTAAAAAAAASSGGGGGGGGGDGGRAPCHGGESTPAAAVVRGYQSVHLDEAAILSKIYDYL
ncbi:unnamed protein product [Pylaiella littoralis]